MSGKLIKDLPALEGGGVSGSVIVPVSQDGETIKSSTVQDIRTIPKGNTINFVDENGNRHAYIDGPIFKDGNDKQVRMFMDLGDDKTGGFFLSSFPDNKNKPLYYDGSSTHEIPYLKEKSIDANGNWYRVWSDGWIEQGGKETTNKKDAKNIVTFVKPFVNPPLEYYAVQSGFNTSTAPSGNNQILKFRDVTNVSMSYYWLGGDSAWYVRPCIWYACGY